MTQRPIIAFVTGGHAPASKTPTRLPAEGTVMVIVTGTANQITVTDNGDGTITLSTPQNTHTGASPTFSGATLNGLTASLLVQTNGSKALASMAKQAHIADAAAVSAISAGAGGDTIDRATLNTDMGTLITEINALKDKINTILSTMETALIINTS